MAGYQGQDETTAKAGKVAKVTQQWSVHEDGVLAHKLQEAEFGEKYSWNKQDRQVARKDVPLARVVHSEEEERLQRERMEYLERQQAQAQKDAEIARKVHQEEVERINKAYARAEEDAAIARQAYEEEMCRARTSRASVHDAELAQRYQQEEMTAKEHLRKEREKRDQELAIQMQENERRKYEIRMQQKSLAKKKKEIQQAQLLDAQRVLGDKDPEPAPDDPRTQPQIDVDSGMTNMSLQDKPAGRVLRPDGKVEDLGDFSDFYIQPSTDMDNSEKRELQELQDEELARLLQDQEHKRGASIDKSRLKQIEDRDAELARVMMEQERLKVLKRKEAKLRQQQQRQMSEPGASVEPAVMLPHRGGSLSSGQERYEQQNNINEHIHSPPNSQEDGSSGGIRALKRQNMTQKSTPVNMYPDRDAHYQSSYGQRPLPATPASDLSATRQGSDDQYSPTPRVHRGNGEAGVPAGEAQTYLRPQRSPSPLEEDLDNAPASSTNVIAAIDPTFHRDHEVTEPPAPQLRTPSPVGPSPPQTVNRLPPTEYENLPSSQPQRKPVTSGPEDGYCDLDDLQNFTPVQGQKRSSIKRESKKGSKKDKNCKQQ